jgi:hypothetical protein
MNRSEIQRCLKKADVQKLYALADQNQVPYDHIISMALASYERSTYQYGRHSYKPADKFELELIGTVSDAIQAKLKSSALTGGSKKATIRNSSPAPVISDRDQAVFYSRMLILAFEEVLQYDPARHHNRPAPSLYIDDADYLRYVRQLLEELKQLNKVLVQKRGQPGPRKVSQLSKHLDKFFSNYAAVLGKGAGYLSVGVAAGLLVQLGIGREMVEQILHCKIGR